MGDTLDISFQDALTFARSLLHEFLPVATCQTSRFCPSKFLVFSEVSVFPLCLIRIFLTACLIRGTLWGEFLVRDEEKLMCASTRD